MTKPLPVRSEKRIRSVTASVCILLLFVFMLCFPEITAQGVREGFRLCAQNVLPALFPFSVLAPLLTASAETLFRTGKKESRPILPLLFGIGILTGFPVGAVCAVSAYRSNTLDRDTASRLAAAACFSPAFHIGYVGGAILGKPLYGLLLWLITVIGAGLYLFLFREKEADKSMPPSDTAISAETVTNALANGVASALTVSGCVVFFSALRYLLCAFCTFLCVPQTVAAVLCGLCEVTSGLAEIGALPVALPLKGLLCMTVLSPGGLSSYLQCAAVLGRGGLSMRFYIPAKLFCTAFSVTAVLLLSAFL